MAQQSQTRCRNFLATFFTYAAGPVISLIVFNGRVLVAQTSVFLNHSVQQPLSPPVLEQTAGAAQAAPAQPVVSSQAAPEPAVLASTSPLVTGKAPTEARVHWEDHLLRVEAFNSSLERILLQIAAKTGARLEGSASDQPVFGTYGPASGSDVLLELLKGSGYNVLMRNDQDTGAPLVIMLSVQPPAGQRAPAPDQRRTPEEAPEPPFVPPAVASSPEAPNQDPFHNGGPNRDPVQSMQEILQRQQQIDEQREKDQQGQQHF